ncbi:SusC/RagA family TonB-linked outer membrane protein [Nonlabens xiamenensis]|uniref:SusC/RagA family TonB-linked outer membrane protein n=1 Tax=Nonlabens xiamenensis TaxID=2341043 RepID=UPI000F611FEF|nr:TonB-dependent receptor [Nonlabens xiamenensis]
MIKQHVKKLIFILTMVIGVTSLAQTISGTVRDSDGPLLGVTVSVQGSTNGTTTDLDGKYELSNVSTGDVIVFSSVGYATKDVVYSGQETLDMVMTVSVDELDRIVVVGYGAKKKSVVTGAISSVNNKEFESATNQNVQTVLQGRTAGVTVVSGSGSPGSGASVRIRGIGTNGNSEPIYIVDGAKVRDGIGYLPPSDIESIEVLKDAASTAIYGADGANGVIVVTTKKGKQGKPRVSYNTQIGYETYRGDAELLNADQFVQYMQEAGETQVVDNGIDTDWLDATFQDAFYQRHDLSVSGATDKINYYLSGGRLDQEGLVGGENSGYERNNVRLNISAQATDWLEVGINTTYVNSFNNTIAENDSFRGVVQNAIAIDPLTPVLYDEGAVPQEVLDNGMIDGDLYLLRNDNGDVYGYPTYSTGEILNPVAYADPLSNREQRDDNLLLTAYGKFKLLDGLDFTTRYSYDRQSGNVKQLLQPYFVSPESNSDAFALSEIWFGNNRYFWENFASYSKTYGKHSGQILVGYSAERTVGEGVNLSAAVAPSDYTEPFFSFFTGDRADETRTTTGGRGQNSQTSIFGRVSYNYDEKYLFEGTFRRDRADIFPPDNRAANFYSGALGWVMSKENFWGDDNPINFAKLRASFGQNGFKGGIGGNSDIIGIVTNTNSGFGISYDGLPGISISNFPNTNLRWETTEQLDIGLDLRLLNNKLRITADYFIKDTKDIIIGNGSLITPPSAGFPFASFNGGTIRNKGFELELGYGDTTDSGFRYDFNVNFSTIDNEVTDIAFVPEGTSLVGAGAPLNQDGVTRFEEGQPVWYFYGFRTDGINPDDGTVNFVDMNGDGMISSADKTRIGKPLPDFSYGANIALGYKGFDFNLLLQGTEGNDIFETFYRPDRPITNKPVDFFNNRWTGPGDTDATLPGAANVAQAYQSDLVVQDGSYMRIKQLQLGYSLPNDLISKLSLNNLRIYASMDDYFTFTKYRGIDPEVNSGGNAIGVDRGTNPITGKIIFGLQARF